jgi:hypothetical protein
MGHIRAYVYVIGRIIKPKPYRVKVSYLPHPVDPMTGRPDLSKYLPEVDLPPLSEPVPKDWTVIDREFMVVYAINVSHLDPITMVAPMSKLDDGVIWMVLVDATVSTYDSIRYGLEFTKSRITPNFI